MVPLLRLWIRAVKPSGLNHWNWTLTGQSAIIYDLNLYNSEDSRRAEMRALPLTLLILLLVFGSMVSGAMPLALGIGSSLLALAWVPVLTHFGPLNILYQNMVSLLGLALGIDYSLFMLSRYRELRAKGRSPEKALVEMMASTGLAVTWSGLTVLIGLAGLLFTPLFEMRSMGWGGIAVVAMSLLLTLSLLPAFIFQLDPWLHSPAWLSRRIAISGSLQRWNIWISWIMKAPFIFLVCGLILLLFLSWPLLSIKTGFPDKPWFPKNMESERGLETLRLMGQSQELTPIDIIVSAEPGQALLPAHLEDIFKLSATLKKDSRVARIFGPVDLKDDLQEFQYRMIYMNLEQSLEAHPELGQLVLSRKRDKALIQVILKDDVGYDAGKAYVRELAGIQQGALKLKVGGHWAFTNDFDQVMLASYPFVFGTVMVVTLAALFVAFASYLVPLKALILNLLSVTASFGATVAVFQWGWGVSFLGLSEPSGAIPLQIPLLVFCITFGLSMDYEVMILSRVREEYIKTHDNEASVLQGIAATGGLISGAAAIMVAVFGAFSLADVIIVKMLGFGLAVAVGLDALVVRSMMVPAAMRLAGKWNWFPGIKEP
jgi:RND superfamily putative drug exporter